MILKDILAVGKAAQLKGFEQVRTVSLVSFSALRVFL